MSELTQDLIEVAQATNNGVQAQSKETEQVAAAINEMSATAHNISQNTSEAAEAAHHANDEALLTKGVVTASIQSIEHLAEEIDTGAKVINNLETDVANITSMVDVIQSIAEQTNLLALNAAIEAARAGEQGRGFAVVADEVRTLASRTQSTTEEIQQMIDKLQNGAQSAVAVMESSKAKGESTVEEVNKTEESLTGIVNAVSTINDMSTQIASASEEQTAVSEEIGNSVTRIAEIADEAATGAKNTEESCIRLANLTQEIRNQLGQFKV
ncbi:methyl-accepting chemotaxis protein [Litoribrevibacter euphylliae]|uniref:Methyl-accepting chemotaxis protein n=1 Tax=Litoribrevibacter euphylliae TaxID=1834034 RepID=A0ABV7HCZ4_9GAMM